MANVTDDDWSPQHRARADLASHEPASDAELVNAIADGDHNALAEIYSRYCTQVRFLCGRICGDAHADDVVQEVFLRLWRNPDRFDPARGGLRTFLSIDARGRAIDLVRSEGSRRSRDLVEYVRRGESASETAAVALSRVVGDGAVQLLSTLRRDERDVIALAYFCGHTYREVAVLLDLPEGTVKSRIRSGLVKLRREVLARPID